MQAASGGWRHSPQALQPQVSSRCGATNNLVLQVVSEVLDTLQQQKDVNKPSKPPPPMCPLGGRVTPSSHQQQQQPRSPEVNIREVNTSNLQHVITASDGQVSNGFVLHGQNLPYVFEEAIDPSGARRKTSKILPVCAVCGKRFVCVTTMKRHLVTHTGEKPFACKICGKQYTQKGNLRVHERTHRNDRPFECQICNQKFYRKEPMQKHQWRQHGIVHMKSNRMHSSNSTGLDDSLPSDPVSVPRLIPKDLVMIQQSTNSSDSFDSVEVDPRNAKSSNNSNSKSNEQNGIHQHYPNNSETSPIKLKMKLAYQQHLLIDQCKAEKPSSNPENNPNPTKFLHQPATEKSRGKIWISSEDKPLDLSSKSNLSDNQPLLLPNFTNSLFPPTETKHISTPTNVPTIQMSENGTLSKLLLQNFTNAKSTSSKINKNNSATMMPNRSKLLHGLFDRGDSRTV